MLIPREIVRQTEKAYLVAVNVDNRRDGSKTKFKWVPKSVCPEVVHIEGYPADFALVPEEWIPNCVW